MMMGVRATLVGEKVLEAYRRCGRSTAGPLGAVEVGTIFGILETLGIEFE